MYADGMRTFVLGQERLADFRGCRVFVLFRGGAIDGVLRRSGEVRWDLLGRFVRGSMGSRPRQRAVAASRLVRILVWGPIVVDVRLNSCWACVGFGLRFGLCLDSMGSRPRLRAAAASRLVRILVWGPIVVGVRLNSCWACVGFGLRFGGSVCAWIPWAHAHGYVLPPLRGWLEFGVGSDCGWRAFEFVLGVRWIWAAIWRFGLCLGSMGSRPRLRAVAASRLVGVLVWRPIMVGVRLDSCGRSLGAADRFVLGFHGLTPTATCCRRFAAGWSFRVASGCGWACV